MQTAESYEGNVENKYLYNDKELFDEGDLNWYDYGFRNYDAQIGRFVQIDPLTDEYALVSGYQYALNDPISNVDVFGLFADNVLQQVMCQGDKIVKTSAVLAAGKATSVLVNTITQGEKNKVAMLQVNLLSYKRLDGYSRKPTLNLIGQDNSKKQTGEKQSVYKSAVPIAISAAAADGPLPIGDVVGGVILAGATIYDATQRTFITYTMTDFFGKVYVGRTSGYGDPYSIMMNRFSNHHMKKFGYKNPELDRAVQGYDGYPAIRGREQQLIDFFFFAGYT